MHEFNKTASTVEPCHNEFRARPQAGVVIHCYSPVKSSPEHGRAGTARAGGGLRGCVSECERGA